MVNYDAAIKRPFKDAKKLLIGAILQIFPVVNFLSMGYHLRCAKSAMSKDYSMPEWTNWGQLFMKGLMSAVIGIIYVIPLGVLAISFIGAAVLAGLANESMLASLGAIGVGGIIVTVVAFVTFYLLPLAILSFVEEDKFGAAFALGKITGKAKNMQYLTTWIVAVIYGVVVSVILGIIPLLGVGLGGFVGGVTTMTLLGEIYPEL